MDDADEPQDVQSTLVKLKDHTNHDQQNEVNHQGLNEIYHPRPGLQGPTKVYNVNGGTQINIENLNIELPDLNFRDQKLKKVIEYVKDFQDKSNPRDSPMIIHV